MLSFLICVIQVKIWFQNRRSKYKKIMKQGGPTTPSSGPCSAPASHHEGPGSPPMSQQPNMGVSVKQQPGSFLDDSGSELHPTGSPTPQHSTSMQHPHPQGTPTPMLAPASSPLTHHQQGGSLSWSDISTSGPGSHVTHPHSQHPSAHAQGINSAYMSHYNSWYGQSNGLSHQQSLLT